MAEAQRKSPWRGLRIGAYLARASIAAQLQYRWDFMIQVAMALFWSLWHLLPLWLVFRVRGQIAGLVFEEAALVLAAYLILRALLEGLINPNMLAVVEHVRQGTLDFVLLKPVDSQVLVSLSRVVPSKIIDLAWGIGLGLWAILHVERRPTLLLLLTGLLMLIVAVAILYSLFLLVICTAFWFVRIDNLAYLFMSIFDAARWPIGVFRGWVRILLTFVLPVALMTSYPALATLGRLETEAVLLALVLAAGFLIASRLAWTWAVAHYESASS